VASTTSVERDDGVETGVWECTPGRWRRQIVAQEFCHFIQGRCTFTPDDGETLHIRSRRRTDVASQQPRHLGYPGNRAQDLRFDFLIFLILLIACQQNNLLQESTHDPKDTHSGPADAGRIDQPGRRNGQDLQLVGATSRRTPRRTSRKKPASPSPTTSTTATKPSMAS
jgi:hypothetical protein